MANFGKIIAKKRGKGTAVRAFLSLIFVGAMLAAPAGGFAQAGEAEGVDWVRASAAAEIGPDAGRIVALGPEGERETRPATQEGLRGALAYVRDAAGQGGGTWLLYIGGDVADNAPAADRTSSAAMLSQATERIGTLVITGRGDDPVDERPATALSALSGSLLTVNTRLDVRSNLVLRNIRYNVGGSAVIEDAAAAHGLYMNGHDLTLGGGSWHTETTNFFGGARSGDISVGGSAAGSADMTVWSTGAGISSFVGGNRTGRLNGDVSVTVNDTSGNIFSVYGSGYGTGVFAGFGEDDASGGGAVRPVKTAPADLGGNAVTTVAGMNTETGGLAKLHGGAVFGDVGGSVTNTVRGEGRFAGVSVSGTYVNPVAFVGGSYFGDIGSAAVAPDKNQEASRADTAKDETNYAIKNDIDTSAWSYGISAYIGANVEAGIIKGNVTNILKAGSYARGSYASFNGLGDYGAANNIAGLQAGGGVGPDAVNLGNAATFKAKGNMADAAAVYAGTDMEAFELTGADEAVRLAKREYSFQVYGNVTNIIKSGSVAVGATDGYLKGAGGGGYIEGSVYTVVGAEGLVWNAAFDATASGGDVPAILGGGDIVRSYTTGGSSGFGSDTGFDLFAGGGRDSVAGSVLINGNLTLVQKEVRARWTYGGNFGGNIIGDTRNELWRGFADAVEGAGYQGGYHIGDSEARVYGGQIDFVLAGGGWSDAYQSGGVKVTVYDGERKYKDGEYVLDTADFDGDGDRTEHVPAAVIHSSMGGTYGGAGPHYIGGDSTVTVYGGDFTGTARAGAPDGFSTGSAGGYGRIYGNGTMGLDLRGNRGGFAIEADDRVSAGRAYEGAGSGGVLGTNGSQILTLNILSDAGSKADISGMDIYGDAAGEARYINPAPEYGSSYIGGIVMNINAPDTHIGNIFATRYSNIDSGDNLLYDVDINLVSAGGIAGLSAAGPTDDITNAVAGGSTNRAEIYVGPQAEPAGWDAETRGPWPLADRERVDAGGAYPPRIKVVKPVSGTARGIRNFTSMTVCERLLIAESGDILNGGGATDANHYNTYNEFGDVLLRDGAGLGARDTDADFIAGRLTVEGRAYVMSPGAKDQISFADIIFENAGSEVVWLKSETTEPVRAETELLTNNFGATEGWPVITFNPDKAAAEKLTPANFSGVDITNGTAYLGDSDTHFAAAGDAGTAWGYAVAVSGDKYEWNEDGGNGDDRGKEDGDNNEGDKDGGGDEGDGDNGDKGDSDDGGDKDDVGDDIGDKEAEKQPADEDNNGGDNNGDDESDKDEDGDDGGNKEAEKQPADEDNNDGDNNGDDESDKDEDGDDGGNKEAENPSEGEKSKDPVTPPADDERNNPAIQPEENTQAPSPVQPTALVPHETDGGTNPQTDGGNRQNQNAVTIAPAGTNPSVPRLVYELVASEGESAPQITHRRIPLGGVSDRDDWSLLSAAFAVVGTIASVCFVTRGALRRKRARLSLPALFFGLLTPVVWLVFDWSPSNMVWVNHWTPVVALVFAVHIALFVLSKRRFGAPVVDRSHFK